MSVINVIAGLAGYRVARDENGEVVSFNKVRQAQTAALAKEYREMPLATEGYTPPEMNGNSAFRADNGAAIGKAIAATKRERELRMATEQVGPKEVWQALHGGDTSADGIPDPQNHPIAQGGAKMTKKVEKTTKKAPRKTKKSKKTENPLVMELREHGRTTAQRFVFSYKGKIYRSRPFVRNNKATADAFKKGLVAWLKGKGVRCYKADARKIWQSVKVESYVPA